MEKLKRKYNLLTTISLVIGIVMGSGIFLKNISILRNTGGNILLSSLVFIIVGIIMIVSAYSFSLAATKIEKVNGVIDYIEDAVGSKGAYYAGFYLNFVYLPIIGAILCYLSASFFRQLVGVENSWFVIYMGVIFMSLSFLVNIAAPKIAGKFQVSTTIIKLVPILIMGTIGIVIGIQSDTTVIVEIAETKNIKFFDALLAAAFAYEGWIISTTVNAEVENSKKNLPRALIIGCITVIVCYVIYNIGITSIIGSKAILESANDQSIVENAFTKLFFNNPIGGKLFLLFIFISCLGVLNGLTMGVTRGMYSLAVRNQGPKPEVFKKLNKKTNTSIASGILAYILTFLFFLYFVLALSFNKVSANIDEISIAFLYAFYLVIYFNIMKNYKELSFFKRFVIPGLAILGSLFLIYASFNVLYTTLVDKTLTIHQRIPYILIIIVISIIIARVFYKKDKIK
ncbi:Amino acid/polyamine transporter I family protein [Alteracholeplasma palmae J233]|uniref:Amino acid/polyamine transporter I family protein n=1 Tax=Alteracholeplasma palmae (strain ATCC 49389 / J233) TaxID=1318466 RepID=U4KPP8_ALTPJ|nr:APC family permease [Alteracholeplasma palmae]CCV64255.1 Amino acid/polyamine transporter I family protein [Alteracholeplasma palmae J233]